MAEKENADDPKLNFKGEPMIGVGPAEQKSGEGSSEAPDAVETETVEFKTTTETFKNEVIVKYDDAIKEGEWKSSTAVKGYDGNAHYWGGNSSVTYMAKDLKQGEYDVYYWVCPHAVCAETLELEINANGEKKVVASRQKLNDGETVEPGWVKLGTFRFKGDGEEYVKLLPSKGSIRTSAVKFVPVK